MKFDDNAKRAREQRLRKLQFSTVDLSPYTNRGFKSDPEKGIIGWSNQGEFDMRDAVVLYGNQTLNGVPFNIASQKSAIVLYSISGTNKELPKEVKGIKIGRKADEIFFLHDSCWTDKKICTYRVNYEDGTSSDIDIYNEKHLIDWISSPDKIGDAMINEGAFLAWQGFSEAFKRPTIIIGLEWKNPHPEKVVRDIDFIGTADNDYRSVPILMGITTAVEQSSQGIVTDVIGVSGVKVKLGNQEQEIYYIGVDPLAESTPFYADAVKQHKDLVLGKKVDIAYDIISQNESGQNIAYIFLSDEKSGEIASMVNGKIIGAGLGKLGNFGGNTKHKMFLENLGFIAQQSKRGIWAENKK